MTIYPPLPDSAKIKWWELIALVFLPSKFSQDKQLSGRTLTLRYKTWRGKIFLLEERWS
jgi:hypothetical protein